MGYTHYWRAKNGGLFTPEEWKKITDDVQKLIAASDVPLLFEEDSNEPPSITDDLIRFNGKLHDGHETFWFQRDLEHFQFCKTAAKPYDKVVVACLAVALQHAPDKIRVSSDGDERDWKEGLDWASAVLGRTIPCPDFAEEDA